MTRKDETAGPAAVSMIGRRRGGCRRESTQQQQRREMRSSGEEAAEAGSAPVAAAGFPTAGGYELAPSCGAASAGAALSPPAGAGAASGTSVAAASALGSASFFTSLVSLQHSGLPSARGKRKCREETGYANVVASPYTLSGNRSLLLLIIDTWGTPAPVVTRPFTRRIQPLRNPARIILVGTPRR